MSGDSKSLWRHYEVEKFCSKSQDKFNFKEESTKKDQEKGKHTLE